LNYPAEPVPAGLHLVATPIGRARDITLRALDTLAGADVLAAEDTRTLLRLMEIHGLAPAGRPLVAYHDHNAARALPALEAHLRSGASVAYASEAGTPLLADPGYRLVNRAIALGVPVHAVPGPSALLAALTVSGLGTDRIHFAGFLPVPAAARRSAVEALRGINATLVLYESPRRVGETLALLAETFGAERPAALCRELTKKFEEIRRGPLGELAERVAATPVRGEVVLVIGRPSEPEGPERETVEAALEDAMKTMRIKDASTAVAGALGLPRREVYQIALGMRKAR